MKFTWNQLTWQPALQDQPVELRDAAELPAAQRVLSIRARANRLYVVGELALAAQLLMELETQRCWA